MRLDTPLHLFTRWALDDLNWNGRAFKFSDTIALLLGAASRAHAVSRTRTRWTSRAPTTPTSRSATASTSVWARRWPGSHRTWR